MLKRIERVEQYGPFCRHQKLEPRYLFEGEPKKTQPIGESVSRYGAESKHLKNVWCKRGFPQILIEVARNLAMAHRGKQSDAFLGDFREGKISASEDFSNALGKCRNGAVRRSGLQGTGSL